MRDVGAPNEAFGDGRVHQALIDGGYVCLVVVSSESLLVVGSSDASPGIVVDLA